MSTIFLEAPDAAQISVRRFFNRLTTKGREPGPDATPWESTSVDASFLALTEPPARSALNPELRASSASREVVKQAFDSFAWD